MKNINKNVLARMWGKGTLILAGRNIRCFNHYGNCMEAS
jgi:hypothetical protein